MGNNIVVSYKLADVKMVMLRLFKVLNLSPEVDIKVASVEEIRQEAEWLLTTIKTVLGGQWIYGEYLKPTKEELASLEAARIRAEEFGVLFCPPVSATVERLQFDPAFYDEQNIIQCEMAVRLLYDFLASWPQVPAVRTVGAA